MKKLIVALLVIVHLLTVVAVLDAVSPSLGLLPDWIGQQVSPLITGLFTRHLPSVFLAFIAVFSGNLFVFILGYNVCVKRRVTGTLLYTSSFIVDLLLIATALLFALLGLAFSAELSLPLKLVLIVAYAPLFGRLFLFVLEKTADTSFFLADILREREEYRRLRYSITREGRLTYIKIDASGSSVDCILSGAATLLIDQALFEIRKSGPISLLLKRAILNFFLYLFSQTVTWPRARALLFKKLTGAKIGKDCLVGQWTKLDPLLPDLIEFEEDCGVGTGCTVLTHSYVGHDRMTFAFGPVKVCRYARVGANCLILPGVTVGEGAIVAAGSVVAEDIPAYSFAAGVPAKPRKKIKQPT